MFVVGLGFYLGFSVCFLLVVMCLVVNTSATDCLEGLISSDLLCVELGVKPPD